MTCEYKISWKYKSVTAVLKKIIKGLKNNFAFEIHLFKIIKFFF